MWRDKLERGASAVEYAVLITVISITTIGGISLVGDTLGQTTEKTATAISGTTQTNPPEQEWDDLSGYSCNIATDRPLVVSGEWNEELGLSLGSLNDETNFLWPTHAPADQNTILNVDMVLPLRDAQTARSMKTWMACGGEPTMTFLHEWQWQVSYRFLGDTEWGMRSGQTHGAYYELTGARMRGNNLVFTQAERVAEIDGRGFPELSWQDEEQILLGQMGGPGALELLPPTVKYYDRWQYHLIPGTAIWDTPTGGTYVDSYLIDHDRNFETRWDDD